MEQGIFDTNENLDGWGQAMRPNRQENITKCMRRPIIENDWILEQGIFEQGTLVKGKKTYPDGTTI